MLRRDLVKKRSSTVQAGSASTLGNSAMELLIVEIVAMKTSAGTSHRNIKHCVNPSQLLFTQRYIKHFESSSQTYNLPGAVEGLKLGNLTRSTMVEIQAFWR